MVHTRNWSVMIVTHVAVTLVFKSVIPVKAVTEMTMYIEVGLVGSASVAM